MERFETNFKPAWTFKIRSQIRSQISPVNVVKFCEKPGDSTCSWWMMHAADADDHAACVGCLDSFRYIGPPRTPSWRCSWTPCCSADGFSTPRVTPGRLSGALRSSACWIWTNGQPLAFSANGPFLKRFSVSLSDSLPVSKHPIILYVCWCLLIFVLINKIGRPHQNCSMSLLSYSWGTLFRSVQLEYYLIVLNMLFNCTHSSSTVLWSV